jgi:RimJ/RimL family protein N-acetyltransferase
MSLAAGRQERPFMFPNGFETPRLILRPLEKADAAPIFDAYAQDPEVTRYLTWRPHTSILETEGYVNGCMKAKKDRTYAIIRKADQALIGAFAARQGGATRLNFGYVLARVAWEHGFASEALSEVVTWALQQPSIWRIGDYCDVENPASARVMEKSGLGLEGILRRWLILPNLGDAPRDSFSYAKTR